MVDGFALGRVDETAGIDDHHVSAHNVSLDGVAGFLDTVHHPLAVHLILGAAKRNKTDICH